MIQSHCDGHASSGVVTMIYMDVSENGGTQKWCIMENPIIRWKIWGYPIFGNTHIEVCLFLAACLFIDSCLSFVALFSLSVLIHALMYLFIVFHGFLISKAAVEDVAASK